MSLRIGRAYIGLLSSQRRIGPWWIGNGIEAFWRSRLVYRRYW